MSRNAGPRRPCGTFDSQGIGGIGGTCPLVPLIRSQQSFFSRKEQRSSRRPLARRGRKVLSTAGRAERGHVALTCRSRVRHASAANRAAILGLPALLQAVIYAIQGTRLALMTESVFILCDGCLGPTTKVATNRPADKIKVRIGHSSR